MPLQHGSRIGVATHEASTEFWSAPVRGGVDQRTFELTAMRATHPLVLLLLITLVPPPAAGAQQAGRVRVLRAAAVLEQPAGEAKPVATVNAGDVLEVLDERETWVRVRPPNGFPRMAHRLVESRDRRVDECGRPAAAAATTTPKLRSRHLRTPKSRQHDARASSSGLGLAPGCTRRQASACWIGSAGSYRRAVARDKVAIVTDFNIGYAPGDQIPLYYSNKAAFTTDDRVDAVGVSGFGVTYMFRRTAPTSFVTGTIGAGAARTFIESSSGESGAGYAIEAGYEFARHFSADWRRRLRAARQRNRTTRCTRPRSTICSTDREKQPTNRGEQKESRSRYPV